MAAIPPVSTETQPDAARLAHAASDNYDTFLILLTAQLQNQDPLAPMDSTQFTQQLVQFSQVEQQIRTNEQLEGLVGQYQAAAPAPPSPIWARTRSSRRTKPISPAAKPTGPIACRKRRPR